MECSGQLKAAAHVCRAQDPQEEERHRTEQRHGQGARHGDIGKGKRGGAPLCRQCLPPPAAVDAEESLPLQPRSRGAQGRVGGSRETHGRHRFQGRGLQAGVVTKAQERF